MCERMILRVARPDHAGGLDELLLTQGEDLGSDDAGWVEPAEDPEHEDEGHHPLAQEPEGDVVEALARRAGERDHEEQHRERHDDLGDAADHRVRPAAVEPGHRAHQDADDHREDRRADRDLERGLRAVEEAQELVAAELAVGAEHEEVCRMLAGRRRRAGVGRVGDPGERARPAARVFASTPPENWLVRAVAEEVRGDRRADEPDQEEQDDPDRRRRSRTCRA